MVGSAGPTMVWSSAPRNRPSMTAKRISIFSRWLRPRAGSSSRLGTYCSVVGNASMGCLNPPLGQVRVVQGRIVYERGRDGDPEVGHRCGHRGELGFVELVEDAPDDPLAQDFDVIEHLASGDGD